MIERKFCTGCSACAEACPRGAIGMSCRPDGFYYPEIGKRLCVDCGLCERICPVSGGTNKDEILNNAYAAKHRDECVRAGSSSGGAFSAIAANVLRDGGVVFGAAFDPEFTVKHTCVDREEDLERLRGSKYVQSRIGDAFSKARTYLEEGRTVLFSGTPCQIAGLKSFLKKDYDGLLTVDFICHGVPSPAMWRSYLRYREQEAGSEVRKVSFRDKAHGWQNYSMALEFADGTKSTIPIREDLYLKGFLSNLFLRRSCYQCKFKGENYYSDLTMGDCWGADSIAPELNDNKGLSLVLSNTPKGEDAIARAGDHLELYSIDKKAALKSNPSYCSGVEYSLLQPFAVSDCAKLGFEALIGKYCAATYPMRIKRLLGRKIAKLLKL